MALPVVDGYTIEVGDLENIWAPLSSYITTSLPDRKNSNVFSCSFIDGYTGANEATMQASFVPSTDITLTKLHVFSYTSQASVSFTITVNSAAQGDLTTFTRSTGVSGGIVSGETTTAYLVNGAITINAGDTLSLILTTNQTSTTDVVRCHLSYTQYWSRI